MVGNVWEWVDTPGTPDDEEFAALAKQKFTPPIQRSDAFSQIRGGSFLSIPQAGRETEFVYRTPLMPVSASKRDIGFRCAKTP